MSVLSKKFFLAAKHRATIAFTITPQVENADGTFTPGTSKSVRGQCKKFRIRETPTSENVSSVDSDRAHNLNIEEDLMVEIEEMQKLSVGANVLSAIMSAFDVFTVTLSYAGKSYGPCWVTRGEFGDGIESKGNGTMSGQFKLYDAGQDAVMPYTDA